MQQFIDKISSLVAAPKSGVKAIIELLDQGATIPFIARYRKEMTGSLDEVVIAAVEMNLEKMRDLDKRKQAILKSIEEQGKLSHELKKKIEKAETMSALEDIYLPYKPKRRTKATIAREKGLEPLARILFQQDPIDINNEAAQFINAEKQVTSKDEALEGARHIIAEWVNEDATARETMRALFKAKATIKSKVFKSKEQEGVKYKDYFEWEEPLFKAPSHRILAMRRGEKEMILSLDIAPPVEEAIASLNRQFIENASASSQQVELAIADCYKRLLKPSIETDMRLETKRLADEKGIQVFADNLRELLLAAPLGQKAVLAIDPGFRTGCKVVCLDKQGQLLESTAIYPNEPQKRTQEAALEIQALCKKHSIEAIAIGNGTAGRETETFVKSINFDTKTQIISVNESGASVYSASEVAREEFPLEDITVRGAVSIGRRLTDPLAELVKIDPKSIGVGQYQHDVDQTMLKRSLDNVVSSCVNAVGVEVNTASKQLLTYVSGLGPQLAQNIVDYRNDHGAFANRSDLKKVARMGDKVFEQAAGFLRIRNAKNPLDRSAVHPESYDVVKQMVKDLEATIETIVSDRGLRSKIDLKSYVTGTVGLPTLTDILEELDKPGRDPRKQFEAFQFEEGVNTMEDLRVGMQLPGIVTNVANFGAFVDVGVHQDGLVHISQLANTFVKDPNQVVKVQQQVRVTVTEVDISRKRIALSMKGSVAPPRPQRKEQRKNRSSKEDNMTEKLQALKDAFKK